MARGWVIVDLLAVVHPHTLISPKQESPMAGPKVSDYLLERLRAWGVEKVFAYPGDGINGLLAAWGC